jgi:TatD DNase family protein
MFDTHCHLNFKAFETTLDETIQKAFLSGIKCIVIPGTDIPTSQRAIEITSQYEGIYAAVGIHPHHVMELENQKLSMSEYEEHIDQLIKTIEGLLENSKVVAVGEIGMDRHVYSLTKYDQYEISDTFIELQKRVFTKQIALAAQYKKSLVIHNREAKQDVLTLLDKSWDDALRNKAVFHCCEADEELLEYAIQKDIFIGVDGDITYSKKKQRFIEKVPLEKLVVETDSPYLTPEPIRLIQKFPNTPSNLTLVIEKIAGIKKIDMQEVSKRTTENGESLFGI